jgi:hydroxyacylglutathione hydrolase/adenylyltransferase/sulfurtransferase
VPSARRYARLIDLDYTSQQVAELIERGSIQLIDVRQEYEWDAGRIAGARHLELMELASRADAIDRNRPVVFYCRSGSRSAMATQAFIQAGYDAHNMAGGLIAWEASGLPLEPSDGYVAG